MFSAFDRLRREWQEYRRFKACPREERRLVVYSEGGGYWTHLGPVVEQLFSEHGIPVAYVTSDEADPIYLEPPAGVRSFGIGSGSIRTIFFRALDADVVLMTMPDLQTYHIKRSVNPIHYVYLHHSLVSTHMVYRPAAFDCFDTILCVGPHHVVEIREREARYGLPRKELVEHGYGRLDQLMIDARYLPSRVSDNGALEVLVAPSWGRDGLLESLGEPLVESLLLEGHRVTVRPHPRTRMMRGDALDALVARFGAEARFSIEEDVGGNHSLLRADVMVSDWSGAALEFAFGLLRPVLFVDVPRKVNNPDYEALEIEPVEVSLRPRLGSVLPPNRISQAGAAVAKLKKWGRDQRIHMREQRERTVFNLGNSAQVGAAYVAGLLMKAAGG